MNYKNIINELFTSLMHEDGSDLHLGEGRKPAMRINGQLLFLVNQKVLEREDMIGILEVFMNPERTKTFLEEKEADFSYSLDSNTHLRGNAFFQQGYICI